MTRTVTVYRRSARRRPRGVLGAAYSLGKAIYNNRGELIKTGKRARSLVKKHWPKTKSKKRKTSMKNIIKRGNNVRHGIGMSTVKQSHDFGLVYNYNADTKAADYDSKKVWTNAEHQSKTSESANLKFGDLIHIEQIGALTEPPPDKVNILGETTPSFVKLRGMKYNLSLFNDTLYNYRFKMYLVSDRYKTPKWMPDDVQYMHNKDSLSLSDDFFRQEALGKPMDFYTDHLSDLEKLNRPLSKRWKILHHRSIVVRSRQQEHLSGDKHDTPMAVDNFAIRNWYNRSGTIPIRRSFKYGEQSNTPTNAKIYMICFAFPLVVNPVKLDNISEAVGTDPLDANYVAAVPNTIAEQKDCFFQIKYTSEKLYTSASTAAPSSTPLSSNSSQGSTSGGNIPSDLSENKTLLNLINTNVNAKLNATLQPGGGLRQYLSDNYYTTGHMDQEYYTQDDTNKYFLKDTFWDKNDILGKGKITWHMNEKNVLDTILAAHSGSGVSYENKAQN